MNNYSALKPGLQWARHKKSFSKDQWSRWVVVEITGKFPFLNAEIVFDPGGTESTMPFERPENSDVWQYGPELDIPSKYWTEVVEKNHE